MGKGKARACSQNSLPQHDEDEGERDEGEEGAFEFLIARGDSAELFDLVDEALDLVALFVALFVVTDNVESVGFWRDDGLDAFGFQFGTDGVAVVGAK